MKDVLFTPVISYVVPSYQHEKYIYELLESIKKDIAALSVPAEIIILDDGSQDNSYPIISHWAQAHSQELSIVYSTQSNKGISAVLNSLIDSSRGEYIRICGSDDVIIAGSTQRLLDGFMADKQRLCMIGDGQVINDEGSMLHESSISYHGASPKRLLDPSSIVKELIMHWCLAGPALLIKRSHYNTMRYNESSNIEDFDLFLSLLKIPNAVCYIDEPVCKYRIHQTNTSKTKNPAKRIKNMHSFLTIIDKYSHETSLFHYLKPLQHKCHAKVNYLEKKYIRCAVNMLKSYFARAQYFYK